MPTSASTQQILDQWPSSDLEYLHKCPVCSSPQRELIHENLSDKLFHCAPGRWTMYLCQDCHTGYLDPRPNEDSIGRAYESYYTHQQTQKNSPIFIKNTAKNFIGSLKLIVKKILNSYRNAYWEANFKPSNSWGRWIVHFFPPLRRRIDWQFRQLPPAPHPSARLLDVGCGNGNYVALACMAGWAAEGIDSDPRAVQEGQRQNLRIHQGKVEDLLKSSIKYERITCSHVIEHFHNPKKALEILHGKLVSGGTLWLQLPNIQSSGHAIYDSSWRGLEPPRHLTLIPIRTLENLLHELNFKCKILPMPLIATMGMHAASDAQAKHNPDAATLPASKAINYSYFLTAVKQSVNPLKSEFITIEAKRND